MFSFPDPVVFNNNNNNNDYDGSGGGDSHIRLSLMYTHSRARVEPYIAVLKKFRLMRCVGGLHDLFRSALTYEIAALYVINKQVLQGFSNPH